jgi:hypothetical protein
MAYGLRDGYKRRRYGDQASDSSDRDGPEPIAFGQASLEPA